MSQASPPFTVSELNRKVKFLLESQLGLVTVTGEISNLSQQRSGHTYFTLKDQASQIRCAFFAQHQRHQPMTYQDGMQVIVIGKLSLYEPRGDYQLIIHQIEEAGLGALYRQFELLKKKLEAEGLFSNQYKKLLPTFPQTIGIITSARAAARRDILITLYRRYPLAEIIFYPSEVQGQTAAQQLCQAIKQACLEEKADVLILARGGGSIEDLWAFNDEQLARCLFQASIPIITGIGHETDVTIADFVADLRAATPTAAATAATPDQHKLIQHLQQTEAQLTQLLTRLTHLQQTQYEHLYKRLCQQASFVSKHTQHINFLNQQLEKIGQSLVNTQYLQHENLSRRLKQSVQQRLNLEQQTLDIQCRALSTLNPLETLNRGFSIATQDGNILTDAASVNRSNPIHIQLAKGQVCCEIKNVSSPKPHQ